MKLYFTPGACSLAPHIALREAGLSFGLEQVDLAKKTTKGGEDFNKVNPKGYVPALELDDGQVLTEVAAVVQYVADQKPDTGLAPRPGTLERHRLQEWLTFISSELHKGFGPLFRPTTPEAYKPIIKENGARRLAFVDQQLEGKDYLMGSDFTVADALLLHDRELDQVLRHEPGRVAEPQGLHGPRWHSAAGPGGAPGRGPAEVTVC